MVWLGLAACERPTASGIQIGETDTALVESSVSTWDVPEWQDAIPTERTGRLFPPDGEPVEAALTLVWGALVEGGLQVDLTLSAPPQVELHTAALAVPTGPASAELSLDGTPTARLHAEWGLWYGELFDTPGGAFVGAVLLDEP
ncbi:MAG: hypothetical protein ABMA64_15590 [Myxococcota bacterium]